MDVSIHLWFGAKKSALHRAIDDATGIIACAWFNFSTKRKLTRIWLKKRRSLSFVRNIYRLMTAFDDVKFEFIQKKGLSYKFALRWLSLSKQPHLV